jgi:hypothetical protein
LNGDNRFAQVETRLRFLEGERLKTVEQKRALLWMASSLGAGAGFLATIAVMLIGPIQHHA